MCHPRGEQTGVHQDPWIINLLQYVTSNLSKNYVLGYNLHLIGSHVKFQQRDSVVQGEGKMDFGFMTTETGWGIEQWKKRGAGNCWWRGIRDRGNNLKIEIGLGFVEEGFWGFNNHSRRGSLMVEQRYVCAGRVLWGGFGKRRSSGVCAGRVVKEETGFERPISKQWVFCDKWPVACGEVATHVSASPNASPLSFHLSVIKKKFKWNSWYHVRW